jgi:hypothetical protein
MQADPNKKWLLARARTIRAGLMLIVRQMDEICIALDNGAITAEQAAQDLNILESLPVHLGAHILTPIDEEQAA